jgi:hypothetical protein
MTLEVLEQPLLARSGLVPLVQPAPLPPIGSQAYQLQETPAPGSIKAGAPHRWKHLRLVVK